MRLNRKWILVIALVMSMATAISGTLAYLTGYDEATNTFTVGNVKIELEEGGSWGTDGYQPTLLPGVAIAKAPKITNTGSTEAWVWMKITVPTNLLDYIEEWDEGKWTRVTPDATEGTNTIVTMKWTEKLAAGDETDPAFEEIVLPTSLTNEDMEAIGTSATIKVEAYAIQSDAAKNIDDAIAAYNGKTGGEGSEGGEGNEPAVPEFAGFEVASDEELETAVANGNTQILLKAGTYNINGSSMQGKTLTISSNEGAVIAPLNEGEDGCDYGFDGSNITFNGITIDTSANTGNYKGFARMDATFNYCTISGAYATHKVQSFNNCKFNTNDGYIWIWGATQVNFDDCEFGGNSKTILAHGGASTVINITDCDFVATEKGYTGAGDHTAAVEIDPIGTNTYTINFSGDNTINGNYSGWTRVKDDSTGHTITGLN